MSDGGWTSGARARAMSRKAEEMAVPPGAVGRPQAQRAWSLPERLDAVVLAAAPNTGPLRQASPEPYEALIPVGQEPIIAHVVRTLARARRVGRIVCVAPGAVLEAAAAALWGCGAVSNEGPTGPGASPDASGSRPERLVAVEPGDRLLANMERGLERACGPYVLLVTGDVPLLRPEMVDDFVERCQRSEEPQDVWYAVVERAAGESRYPGLRRTWVRLADGTFTGGNLAVVERHIVARTRKMLELAVAARKNPLALARLLGVRTLWRFVRGRLTVAEVEARVGRMLGIKGRAVVTPHVEIGIDVDKPADLLLARRYLTAASPGR